MKIKLIGCQSNMNEILAQGLNQGIDCTFLDHGLQTQPEKLHAKIQQTIKESQDYDLIILVLGPSTDSTLDLISRRVPVVLISAHNYVGQRPSLSSTYAESFSENAYTIYFSQGILDDEETPLTKYYEFESKYGEKTAHKCITDLYGSYRKAIFITTGIRNLEIYRRKVQEIVDFFSWEIEETEWTPSLIGSVVKGLNLPKSFLVEAGQAVTSKMLKAV